jgi:flavin-dependent dehydrogenase
VVKEVDVLVVGAGPAGATAALNLAPTRSVLVVDCREFESTCSRIGESLPPAARRLLADMGLLESFLAQQHEPCYGNRSVWGGSEVTETDLLRDPDGHGWHLDRRRFDIWLHDQCSDRGAELLAPANLQSVERNPSGEGWAVVLSSRDNQTARIEARILVDATGRLASLSRRLRAKQQSSEPPMICMWTSVVTVHETPMTAGFTFLEAVPDGWWYTAPLPKSRRVLAFHTDPDTRCRAIAQTCGRHNPAVRHS